MAQLFCTPVNYLENLDNIVGQEFNIGGIISEVQHKISKRGNNWALFKLNDYSGVFEMPIFGQEYEDFKHFLLPFLPVRIKVNIGHGYDGSIKINFEKFEFLKDVSEEINRKVAIMKYIKEKHGV